MMEGDPANQEGPDCMELRRLLEDGGVARQMEVDDVTSSGRVRRIEKGAWYERGLALTGHAAEDEEEGG